jgi:hypothetical protein
MAAQTTSDWTLQAKMAERCAEQGHQWETVDTAGLRVDMVCRWCNDRRRQAAPPPKRPTLGDVITTKGRRV